MKHLLILLLGVLTLAGLNAQTIKKEQSDPSAKIDTLNHDHFPDRGTLLPSSRTLSAVPRFPGGEEAMNRFIGENLKYPEIARSQAHEGFVTAEFTVEKDGAITQVKVLKGIGLGCDEATREVLESMPKWEPGYQNGKEVAVKYITQVKFRLY